jgi:hypothetical protein
MSLPAAISVSFDFSQGATFGFPFTIGDERSAMSLARLRSDAGVTSCVIPMRLAVAQFES